LADVSHAVRHALGISRWPALTDPSSVSALLPTALDRRYSPKSLEEK
jgi:hypothetical protein